MTDYTDRFNIEGWKNVRGGFLPAGKGGYILVGERVSDNTTFTTTRKSRDEAEKDFVRWGRDEYRAGEITADRVRNP